MTVHNGRKIMSEVNTYIPIEYYCKNCGFQLEAAFIGHTFWGDKKLIYRHVNHKVNCTIYKEAAPFDGYAAIKRYKEALKNG